MCLNIVHVGEREGKGERKRKRNTLVLKPFCVCLRAREDESF